MRTVNIHHHTHVLGPCKLCWHTRLSPPRILAIRLIRAKSLNFIVFNWKQTHINTQTNTNTRTHTHWHTHTKASTGPGLLIKSRDCAALIINFYAGPPITNPSLLCFRNSIKSLLPDRKTSGDSRDAVLLHSGVVLHIKCLWMVGPHGDESKMLAWKRACCADMQSTCSSFCSLTLIDASVFRMSWFSSGLAALMHLNPVRHLVELQ